MSIALLSDTGSLIYNGVKFLTLWKSHVSGTCEYDKARRAVKYVRWTIEVEGFVTLNGSLSLSNAPAAATGSLQGTTDRYLSAIRSMLMQPGKALFYTGKGFGPLRVNVAAPGAPVAQGPAPLRSAAGAPTAPAASTGGGVWDVAWGPHPELLDFTPMGGPSAMVKWRVEFCIPQCPGAAFTRTLLAFNWNATIDLAEDRYARLTMAGELEIAQTYGQPDDVMSWRTLTTPVMPVGFTMGASNEGFSDDKRTFTWSYSYQEMPPFGMPFGATDASGRFRVRSQNRYAPFAKWSCSLSATYNIRPDYPRREAWLRFLALANSRLRAARYAQPAAVGPVAAGLAGGGQVAGGGGVGAGLAGGAASPPAPSAIVPQPPSQRQPGTSEDLDGFFQTCFRGTAPWHEVPNLRSYTSPQPDLTAFESGKAFITSFGFDEGLYKDAKTISFDLGWVLFTTLNHILAASGVWTKVMDCNKALWRASMQGISGATAWQNLFLNTGNDVILDACSGAPHPDDRGGSARRSTVLSSPYLSEPSANVYDPDDQSRPELRIKFPGCPSPDQAWLNYGNWFETQLDPGTCLHKPLPSQAFAYDTLATVARTSSGVPVESVLGNTNLRSASTQSDYVVRAATSTYKVTLKGFGVRAGYTVPVPGLVSFAGITPVPTRWQKVIGDKVIGNYNGIPVYFKYWELPYLIPVPPVGPTQLPPPNFAAHIGPNTPVPATIYVPQSLPQPNTPVTRQSNVPVPIRQANGPGGFAG